MGLAILLVSFFALLAIGFPIAFALAAASLAAILYEGIPVWILAQRMSDGIQIYSLLAIPFFIFAGEVMLHGGLARRLVDLASAAVGWMRGGLGVVNVFASMLFGGISGSAVADTSALGSIMIPMMKKSGYDADYAVNVTITSSVAGLLIPPSHNMILYMVAAGGGVSIVKLFLAGIVPGILMCVCLALAAWLVAVRRGYPAVPFAGLTQVGVLAAHAFPGLFTAILIIGGVLSGVMTVTESAGVGAIYALLVTALFYRSLDWPVLRACLVNTFRMTAIVMMLVAGAQAFAWLLTLYQVPALVIASMSSISDNPLVIFLLVNLILLLLGAFMDMGPLILICTPIFLPVMVSHGMDPLQFGMILMMNLGIGLCTPPVGALLFIGCTIGEIGIEDALRSIWPFYAAIFVALMLLTYVPAISLTIPGLLD